MLPYRKGDQSANILNGLQDRYIYHIFTYRSVSSKRIREQLTDTNVYVIMMSI